MTVIGTRGSKLALVQAEWVASELAAHGVPARIHIIKTKGDVIHDRFDKIEGKGFFTTEIENALRDGEIDIAVHCLKDLPTAGAEGLQNQAIPEREDPHDILISGKPFVFRDDPFFGRVPNFEGLRIGTSSNRRVKQLEPLGGGFVPIRGNVPTRIQKMLDGEADVIVLAKAGLNRLGMKLEDLHLFEPDLKLMAPAPGQGALAIQTRVGYDLDLGFLHHEPTHLVTAAERKILSQLEGGCQLPLGVLVQPADAGGYRLDLFLAAIDGRHEPIRRSWHGATPDACAEAALAHIRSVL